ncbi:MAG: MarR family transcriptional regulator [Leptotrichiaceae bacterium]|nr:MarR family transcriptional regulator [Leptotrichiaceae bacterium]MBP7101053.1 MarR family transcriptional regulator [Leptotrichiaceae bacterium]MBP9630321.1 MarR family transcriptional regulator [Leptotrichiaceae bacterium]
MKLNCGLYISRIRQINGRIMNKILSEKNISAFNGEQGRILHVLWEEDGISIKELSFKTGLAVSTLTKMIDRMEEANLIKRIPDKKDRRKILIKLTEYTNSLKGVYDEISQKMTDYSYDGFSENEIETMERLLKKMLNNVEKAERENK